MKKNKDGKPIIRHCQTCKWHARCLTMRNCQVKYRDIKNQRLAALLCRYYECKEV